MTSRLEHLMSEALGYPIRFDRAATQTTKKQRLERKLANLEQRQLDRISKGRTRGAGAGGFNHDVENIVHQIRLVRIELECQEG